MRVSFQITQGRTGSLFSLYRVAKGNITHSDIKIQHSKNVIFLIRLLAILKKPLKVRNIKIH